MRDGEMAWHAVEADVEAMLQEKTQEIRDLQQRMRDLERTATSPRRTVSITVGHGGTVRDITFSGSGYKRMAPRELSDMIMTTLTAAQDEVASATAEIMSESMPTQANPARLLRGDLELADLLPDTSMLRQFGLLPERRPEDGA